MLRHMGAEKPANRECQPREREVSGQRVSLHAVLQSARTLVRVVLISTRRSSSMMSICPSLTRACDPSLLLLLEERTCCYPWEGSSCDPPGSSRCCCEGRGAACAGEQGSRDHFPRMNERGLGLRRVADTPDLESSFCR